MGQPVDLMFLEEDKRRFQQQDFLPTSIKNRLLSQNLLTNTTVYQSAGNSVPNNAALTITSIIANSSNSAFIIGGLPYMIAFFQGSLTTANLIPDGGSITVASYQMIGPIAMPNFSPNATSGSVLGGSSVNNLVFKTQLINKTGSTQTIYYITHTRVLATMGGAEGQT